MQGVRVTINKGFKKLVRDIQDRSGWNYQVAHRFVSALGYDYVSKRLDDAAEAHWPMENVRTALLLEAREKDGVGS